MCCIKEIHGFLSDPRRRGYISLLLSVYHISVSELGILFIIYIFLAVLGLHCCAWAFSSCDLQGLLQCMGSTLLCLLLLGVWALGPQASAAVVCGLSSCAAWVQLTSGMWNLPGPTIEPVSPALAGEFLSREVLGIFNTWYLIDISQKLQEVTTCQFIS